MFPLALLNRKGLGLDLDPAKVKLLLHFDADFADSSPNNVAVTATGNVAISALDTKFGVGKVQYGASPRDGKLKTPLFFNFGNHRPFTLCFWAKGGDVDGALAATRDTAVYTPFELNRSGSFLFANGALTGWTLMSVNNSAPEWTHFAVVADGTNIKAYKNGVLQGSGIAHPNWPSVDSFLSVGKSDGTSINAALDEFLLYDGVLWTGDFTPPTVPLGVGQQQQQQIGGQATLLMLFEGANGSTIFTDSSSQNNTITRYGSPSITTSNSKFGNSCLGINATSYLKINRSESFDIGAGQPFTIQMWLYITGGTGAYGGLISMRDAPVYCPIEVNITNNGTLATKIGNATLDSWDSSSFTMLTYVWRHFAIVGDGSLIKVYNHGVQSAAFAQPHWPNDEYPLQISRNGDNQMQSCAYIDYLSFHKAAFWLSDFTPPTSEFTY